MTTGLIIDITEDHVPPKQFMELVWSKFTTYIGSVVHIAGDKPELVLSGSDELPPIDDFLSDLEKNKADKTVLHFTQSKTKLTDESEQPFVILRNDDGDPILVAMLEGEYFSPTGSDPAHTDEYHVVNGVLIPRMLKMFTKMYGSDIEKFDEELGDDETIGSINSLCGTRGIVVLQSITGTTGRYEKGNDDLRGEFPWGFVSNKLGFVEKSSKDVPTGRGGLLNKAKNILHISDTKPVESKTIADQLDKTTADTAVAPKRPMIKPPADIIKKGKNATGQWYKDWGHGCADALPTNYKEGVEVEANDKYIAQNAKKFGNLKDKLAEFQKNAEKAGAKLPAISPIIVPKMKQIINELLDSGAIKAITDKAQVLDPDKLKAGPDVAPFSAQIGRDFTETFRWDGVVFDIFIRRCQREDDYTPVRQLFAEYQQEMFKLLAGEKKEEPEVEVEIPADKQEPKTSVPSVTPAKKPGGLLNKRKAA